jgi:hypothetical protein
MNSITRRNFIIISAGLLGIAAGQMAWSALHQDDSDTGHDNRAGPVSIAMLAGTVSASQRIGGLLRLDDSNLVGQAALSFAVGAGASVVLPAIRRLLPGLGVGSGSLV